MRRRQAAKGVWVGDYRMTVSSGVDRTYISELENDLKSPTVDTLERLCAAMGVKASQLLARAEKSGAGRKKRPSQ